MSAASSQYQAASRQRQEQGTTVTYRRTDYRVTTSEVAGNKAGAQAVSRTAGIFIAAADPRSFTFDARQFRPWATQPAPMEGSLLIWHGRTYEITHIAAEDLGDNTMALTVYALCVNWGQ